MPNGKVAGILHSPQPYPKYKPSGVEWLGDIPSHWETQKLKFCSAMNGQTLSENTDPNLTISYVDIGSVSQGRIEQTKTFLFRNAPSRARRVARKGDTIISTVRTYLKAIAHVGENDAKNIFSTGFCVLSPNKKFHKRYFSYFSQSAPFVNEIVSYSKGVSFPAITPVELGNLFIGVPPLPEQHRIATFLDQKTAEIDEAISKKQRLIDLLKEQKAILINQAVTKGLNPNVLMKDSGVEWIGEVPAHWEVRRAKYVFREVDERSKTGSEELLSVSHMTGVTPRSEKSVYMFMAEDYAGSKLCRKGDLVINIMWAWMGALGVSDRVGIVSPSYGIFRQQKKEVFNAWYLEHLLRSVEYVAEYNRRSTGLHSSRLRLYADMFLAMELSVPSKEEQDHLESITTKRTNEIDKTVDAVERKINALNELKAILISQAVTGKIKI